MEIQTKYAYGLGLNQSDSKMFANVAAGNTESFASAMAKTAGQDNPVGNTCRMNGSETAETGENASTAFFDTDQGRQALDIDAYFSFGGAQGSGASLLGSLPPLLLPTEGNIQALTAHLSNTFPEFLSENGIPEPPSDISYDSQGNIQLPSDYAYADELKQALGENPAIDSELRTLSAVMDCAAGMRQAGGFIEAYAAAGTEAETESVVARYGSLFSAPSDKDYGVLHFSSDGRLDRV